MLPNFSDAVKIATPILPDSPVRVHVENLRHHQHGVPLTKPILICNQSRTPGYIQADIRHGIAETANTHCCQLNITLWIHMYFECM